MGFFSKKGGIVDLSDMKRRGLLPNNSFEDSNNINEDGIIDLSVNSSATQSVGSVGKNNTEDASGLGFLGNLAGVGNSMDECTSEKRVESGVSEGGFNGKSYTERLRMARRGSEGLEVQHLKTKIEDLEYKMDRLVERLRNLERKS